MKAFVFAYLEDELKGECGANLVIVAPEDIEVNEDLIIEWAEETEGVEFVANTDIKNSSVAWVWSSVLIGEEEVSYPHMFYREEMISWMEEKRGCKVYTDVSVVPGWYWEIMSTKNVQ